MKRAGLYARISYYDAKGGNLDGQLKQCREYAAGRGYDIVAELTEDDHGASGASFDLPALNKALDLARRGRIDVLVTRELDRFARGLAKQLLKEREFQNAGVEVEYVLGEYADTPEGQLTKHVRAIIAEYEREKIAERMERGRIRAVERGVIMIPDNAIPFGYRIVVIGENGHELRTLEIDEDAAGWVREMFRWYVFGDDNCPPMSLNGVAKRLTELGVPRSSDRGRNPAKQTLKRGTWVATTVRHILRNETYTGIWRYRSAAGDIEVAVPAIIDKALFARAQSKLNRGRELSARNTRYPYLLRGRLYCGECGYKLVTMRQPPRRYYRCPGSVITVARPIRCTAVKYNVQEVDSAVWDKLRFLMSNPDILDEAYLIAEDGTAVEHLTRQLEQKRAQYADKQAELERALDLYFGGEHTQAVLAGRQAKLERELAQIQRELDDIATRVEAAADRIAQLHTTRQHIAEMAHVVERADLDPGWRRHYVDALNVTVALEVRDGVKCAHISIDGVPLARVSLSEYRPLRK